MRLRARKRRGGKFHPRRERLRPVPSAILALPAGVWGKSGGLVWRQTSAQTFKVSRPSSPSAVGRPARGNGPHRVPAASGFGAGIPSWIRRRPAPSDARSIAVSGESAPNRVAFVVACRNKRAFGLIEQEEMDTRRSRCLPPSNAEVLRRLPRRVNRPACGRARRPIWPPTFASWSDHALLHRSRAMTCVCRAHWPPAKRSPSRRCTIQFWPAAAEPCRQIRLSLGASIVPSLWALILIQQLFPHTVCSGVFRAHSHGPVGVRRRLIAYRVNFLAVASSTKRGGCKTSA